MGLYSKGLAQQEIVRAAKRLHAFLLEHVTDDPFNGITITTYNTKTAELCGLHLAELMKAIEADGGRRTEDRRRKDEGGRR